MKRVKFILPILLLTLAINCKKENNGMASSPNGQSNLTVALTDAPGPFKAVTVDIRNVAVMGDAGEIMLTAKPGSYNLLDWMNGKHAVIATAGITGKLSQIRLILGPDNWITVGDNVYPLTIPSGEESGLKLNLNKILVGGVSYTLLIDFDVNKSIVHTGNGRYILKPVLRLIDEASSGAIKGVVMPAGIVSEVSAEAPGGNAMAALTTMTESSGYFLLQGVPEGSYTVTVTPPPPYSIKIFNKVNVTVGNVTDMGQIAVEKTTTPVAANQFSVN